MHINTRRKIMKAWYQMAKRADFNAIANKFNISPVLARIIRNRDVTEEKDIDFYLNGTIDDLYDGMLIKDMDKALDVIKEKIENGDRIRILGDYDSDGVNATYILLKGIKGLGGVVDADIPDRVKDGYGLNISLIDKALNDKIDTIITCDNGIAAYNEILYAKEKGMSVIVTDHHEVPFIEENGEVKYILPPADAVIDIQRKSCSYPFKGICGAAVAYKLVEALYNVSGRDSSEIYYLMENVAIATVTDVMQLVDENRIFVKEGLRRLSFTSNPGLKALIDLTKIPSYNITPYHIGFILGPCINASGRLETAKKALALLNAENETMAYELAEELVNLNDIRKDMTEKWVEYAVEEIESSSMKNDKVMVVYLPECHESIAGIIAGRIRERYYRPAFVLTKGEDCVKGSGRSIDTYNMFEEMNKCKDLFIKFGGHKLAAGLSISEENVDVFRKRINDLCELTEKDFIEKIYFDMTLPFGHITEGLIEEFKKLEPCGNGNTRAMFAEKNVTILSSRIVGKNKNVVKLRLKDCYGTAVDGVYFGDAQEFMDYTKERSSIAIMFYPDINEYMGMISIQIVVKDYK